MAAENNNKSNLPSDFLMQMMREEGIPADSLVKFMTQQIIQLCLCFDFVVIIMMTYDDSENLKIRKEVLNLRISKNKLHI